MGSITLNSHHMSRFTRDLCDYQRSFINTPSNIKRHLVGRVVTLAVSLILHAEAVIRAVYICFLRIQEIFSSSMEDLIKKQSEERSIAFGSSLHLFRAVFTLDSLQIEQESPQTVQRQPVETASSSSSVTPASEATSEEDGTVLFLDQLPHPAVLSPIEEHPSQESSPEAVVSRHLEPPPVLQANLPAAATAPVPTLPPRSHPSSPRSSGDVLTPRRVGLFTIPSPRRTQSQPVFEPVSLLNADSAMESLMAANQLSAEQLRAERGPSIVFQPLPLDFKHDQRFQVHSGIIGNSQFSICLYSPDPQQNKVQKVAEFIQIEIGQTKVPVWLFGIFDAQGGPQATNYLALHIKTVICRQLILQNKDTLTSQGIINALRLAFDDLNRGFVAENAPLLDIDQREPVTHRGATLQINMIIEDHLYTFCLGNQRGFIDNKDNLIPIGVFSPAAADGTPSQGIGFAHLGNRINRQPTITSTLLSDIRVGAQLCIASGNIFPPLSRENVFSLLKERSEGPEQLAKRIAYTTSLIKKSESFACAILQFGVTTSEQLADDSYEKTSLVAQLKDTGLPSPRRPLSESNSGEFAHYLSLLGLPPLPPFNQEVRAPSSEAGSWERVETPSV